MIFPDLTNVVVVGETQTLVTYGKELNLQIIDGNPVVVDGIDALKIWIDKALKTARYRWAAYTWDYGSEIEDLIEESFTPEIFKKEVQRIIKETLSIDKRISEIKDFIFEQNNEALTVTFTVVSALEDTINIEVRW